MDVSDVRPQPRIVEEFYRRRRRELLALPLGGLAFYVAWQAYHDPTFAVLGLKGLPLLVLAAAVVVAYFAHHLVNWRCPACGRHFFTGFVLQSCPHCGALFVKLRPRATRADLEALRKKYDLRMLTAVLLIALGMFLMMYLANQPGVLRDDGWLSRLTGGEPRLALLTTGFVIAAVGFLWTFRMIYVINGIKLRLQEMRRIVQE
ncbi:MAG TPA: hypothetical protein VFR03_07320 [Thermoanaerobaculia bacterium]|nr:hypothetical protein [Thermoanaerobaculia bacterium]